jgi:hypothetical protein
MSSFLLHLASKVCREGAASPFVKADSQSFCLTAEAVSFTRTEHSIDIQEVIFKLNRLMKLIFE